jgi:hypothetical protein
MKKEIETISLREFARRMNVGEKTIRDGIHLEKIKKGVVYKDGKPKIDFDIAKKEFEAIGLGHKNRVRSFATTDPKNITNKQQEEIISGVSIYATLSEAVRMEKIFKARTAGFEASILAGKYVDKAEVDRELFEFGSIVRQRIQAIPDRISDQLIALANDRNQFNSFLSESIDDALRLLSKYNTNDTNERSN